MMSRTRFAGLAGAVLVLAGWAAPSSHAGVTHRYSFNDGTANDSVGNADGTLVNGPTVVNGTLVFGPLVNTGFNRLPSTGQYVDLPNNIARTRALTLEVWATYRSGQNVAWQRIVDFGNSTAGEILPDDKTTINYSGRVCLILVPQNGNGNPTAQLTIGNATDFIGLNTPITTDVEHQIVFTHDPDANVQALYVDGVKLGQNTVKLDPSTSDYKNYWLGRSNFFNDPFFNGTINEFRIYDSALSGDDVANNFRNGPDVPPAPVPEPAAGLAALAAAGAIALGGRRRRR
jgi:hypothetical protein